MNFYLVKLIKLGVILTVSLVVAAGEPDDDNTFKQNLDFDLTQVRDGSPLLQIRRRSVNDGSHLTKKNYEKRALRGGSSSESEENIDDKEEEGKENIRIRDTESEDADSSESDNDRRWSTKGPGDFEPESNPSIHGRYNKDSESE